VKEVQVIKEDPKEEFKKSEKSVPSDISVVYCIDISGSMRGYRIEAVKKTIRA
jgi:Mg-chelatase subunit ChlD